MLKKIGIVVIPVILIIIAVTQVTSEEITSEEITSEEITSEEITNTKNHLSETNLVVTTVKSSRPDLCDKTNSCYLPYEISITPGESVTWLNEDSAFHSITSGNFENPDGLFDSGHLDPSETFSYTFETSGTFEYYCTLHPWMQGFVIVER